MRAAVRMRDAGAIRDLLARHEEIRPLVNEPLSAVRIRAMRTVATPRQRLLAALADGDSDAARELLAARPDPLATLTPEDGRLLAEAATAGHTRAVELMLDLGFDPAATDADGATALHRAAWAGAAACVEAILRHEGAASLVERREPTYGATPLGWCVHGSCHGVRPESDHPAVARMLLEAGARPDVDPGEASGGVRAVIQAWRGRA